ncbi:MAG: hybrid sensor histidine kinase/response regulator [Cellvibrionaceae bacterium]
MSFSFFTPQTKVHKQRNIMRETDVRLVRYSKRGLALSLIVFCIGMFLGKYYDQQPTMAMIFAVGIVVAILFRSYYLFRFDAIYARAPARWRNIYFVITIIGAAWWGGMLAAVTYEIGLQYETPLLWLYTIAFFTSCSHIFSPYQRFYTLYMLMSLLPCSFIAMLSLEALDSIYGAIMLILFLLLQRQGISQGNAYWDRLQATYDLTQRANALEAEKITSQSTLSDKDTLFMNLAGELKKSLIEIMGSLQLLKLSKLEEEEEQLVGLAEQKSQQQLQMLKNVLEFSHISRKEVILSSDVIDLRGSIEKAIVSASDLVYKKNHELLTQFTADFPIRVRGDAERIEQIIINMISNAVDYADKGSLFIDVTYIGDSEKLGRLKIAINIDNPLRNPEIEQQLHDAFKPHYANNMSQGLSLAIAKGLSNCMQGSAGANYTSSGELRFWFSANLPTVTPANSATHNISKLNGKRILLYQPPQIIEDEYKNTLEAWGLVVDIIYDYDDAIAAVKHACQASTAFDLIMIYTHIDNLEGAALAKMLAEETSELSTPQLLCVTEVQSKSPVIQQLVESAQVEVVLKPINYKQLRKRFKDLLINDNSSSKSIKEEFLGGKKVLLLQNEEIDRTIAEVMLKKLGCSVVNVNDSTEAMNKLTQEAFDAFITESYLADVDMKEFIETAKAQNQLLHASGYRLPILGLSHQEQQGEETRCLQSGMNYYIDSPLQIDDLRAILRRWIGRAIHLTEADGTEENKT